MKINLENNLFLKLISMVSAVVLWVVVVSISDAEVTETFTKEVTLLNTEAITESGNVFRIEEGSNIVKLKVEARKSVMQNLDESDFVLTADMEKNLKYGKMVVIDVKCSNKNIDVDRDVTLLRNNVEVSIEEPRGQEMVRREWYGDVSADLTTEQNTARIRRLLKRRILAVFCSVVKSADTSPYHSLLTIS
jgi:YbbR domain-containing protein